MRMAAIFQSAPCFFITNNMGVVWAVALPSTYVKKLSASATSGVINRMLLPTILGFKIPPAASRPYLES